MNNKTAVISGGGALATAFVKKLTSSGWHVALLSKSKPKDFGGLFFECNLAEAGQVESVMTRAQQELGSLEAAIHTAISPIVRKRALDISVQEFKGSFLVDVFGGFVFFQSAGRLMKQQGYGRMISLTTEAIESQKTPSRMAGYVSAKFALKGLLKALHQELAASHIAVSALAPGMMDTPLNSDLPPRLLEFIKERQGGKLTEPAEVAEVLERILSLPEGDCSGKTFFISPGTSAISNHAQDF